jgi:hypothetical protein
MPESDSYSPLDPFGIIRRLMAGGVNQDILPGWFGVTINENNSSAPSTEQRILAKESYGRQMGKMMDAVAVLIEAEHKRGARAAEFNELIRLKDRIDKTKAEAARDRLKRLKSDLTSLKENHEGEYHALLKDLRTLIAQEYEPEAKATDKTKPPS